MLFSQVLGYTSGYFILLAMECPFLVLGAIITNLRVFRLYLYQVQTIYRIICLPLLYKLSSKKHHHTSSAKYIDPGKQHQRQHYS